jgi:ribonuclease HI
VTPVSARALEHRSRAPVTPGMPVAGLAIAAALYRPGEFGWAQVTDDGARTGIVRAQTPAEADTLIARDLREVLPATTHSISIGLYRVGGIRRRSGQSKAVRRPWETAEIADLLPACSALANERSAGTASSAQLGLALAAAAALLPVTPVHPAMPRVSLPGEAGPQCPWIVASDGSVRAGRATWAFVTGAGWADWGVLPAEATSTSAEFTAYCHALAIYPDDAAVTLVTDSEPTARMLLMMAESKCPPGWLGGHLQQPDRRQDGMTQAVFDLTMHHARRLRLNIRWSRRNTHPLQAAAHRLCRTAPSA